MRNALAYSEIDGKWKLLEPDFCKLFLHFVKYDDWLAENTNEK
jgi:hypothetical protein